MEQTNLANKIKPSQYLAGIILANAPVFIFNSFRDTIFANVDFITYMGAIILLIFSSSFLSGYLLARKTSEIYQRSGLTLGLLSYLTYLIFSWLFGIGILPFESAASLTFFVIGAILGAKFSLNKNHTIKRL
ncbi:hypothetical protein FJY84_07365 [Candidatus Bathyarchaeota archaeon]|nr:hypothetical protein [Candidatus Bathyarchaeota archaeon]